VVVLAGIGTWLGLSWYGTYQQAQDVQRQVSALRVSLAERQWAEVPAQVSEVKVAAQELETSTNGPIWRLLEGMPVIGYSASAVNELAGTLVEVADAAEPLTPFAQRILDGDIRRPDGSVDLDAMQQAAPLLTLFTGRVETASGRLEAIDVDRVRPEIGGPVAELREELEGVLPALSTASEVATWLPGLLGGDGQREWLVMLQNPAELRGSGGLVGGFAVIKIRNGTLELETTGSSSDLQQSQIPIDNAPADVRETWGDGLRNWASFNASPHFPTTAALAADGMTARGQSVDGVIALDPEAVAAMLEITGPITAAGKTVSADDVAQFFTVDAYTEYPDGQERDEVSLALVEALFSAFLTAKWRPETLLDAMREPVEERRVLVWSQNEEEEAWLAGTALGGSLPNQPGSVIAVTFNNMGANKLDAFLTTEVTFEPGRCPTSSTQRSTLNVSMLNDPPSDLPEDNYGYLDQDFVPIADAPPGSNSLLVQVYAPVGANYRSSALDGVDVPMYVGTERNRPLWWTIVELRPGEERNLDVVFEEPTVLGVEPSVMKQPMVNEEVITVAKNGQC